MNKHILFTLSILSTFLNFIWSQDTTAILYFKSGQSTLSTYHKGIILKSINKPIEKIVFEGYADTIGKSAANKKLSLKRAQMVANEYLLENMTIEGKGEVTDLTVPFNKMRKVEIKIWYKNDPIPLSLTKIDSTILTPIDLCQDDTILSFESGVQIKMNRCYYYKVKNCFSFSSYFNPTSLREANLQTIDDQGNPLISGGMLKITSCNNEPFEFPIETYWPVPPCLENPSKMSSWTLNENNQWVNSNEPMEIVELNGIPYYRFQFTRPGIINCDMVASLIPKKMKFKMKNNYTIEYAHLSYGCPLYRVPGEVNKKGRKVTFDYFCTQEDPILFVKATDKDGKIFFINDEPLSKFKHKQKLRQDCIRNDVPPEKYLGIISRNKQYMYRKYKLFKSDFK